MRRLLVPDEREAAVEQSGDRLAYIVVSYGLLLIVAYRSIVDERRLRPLAALALSPCEATWSLHPAPRARAPSCDERPTEISRQPTWCGTARRARHVPHDRRTSAPPPGTI